ncbi:hypothetical protein V1264_007548 [Littorina saxatilis]|uniref:Glycosyltransferase family 92 protein n=2 Tax=Littorina saxatilis TaxID=31220 RepID=A0AAN9AV61_9CAEN
MYLLQQTGSFEREKPPLHIVGRGENIRVGGTTEVHVMSAIARGDYPVPNAFNVVLITWADNNEDQHSFFCCFASSPEFRDVLQIPARKLFFDQRYTVYLRYALFACSAETQHRYSNTTSANSALPQLRYVAFAEKSCLLNITSFAHEIAETEKTRGGNFAVCLKTAYGELDERKLVEWFEFAKIVGVSVVQVFYHIVNEKAMTVFRYYEKTGFVVLLPVTPAILKGSPPRGFMRPRWDEQAWMDGTVICNDCLHRLSQYEFVAIMDFDELLLPSPPFNSLSEVMQDAAKKLPLAGSFFIDTYIVLLDWPEADRKSPIFFLRYLDRSVSRKLDNFGLGKSSPKVIVRPLRMAFVTTHDTIVNKSFTKARLPKRSYTFLHYRQCKKKLWGVCPDMEKVRDRAVVKFQSQWVQAINRLPLLELGCGKKYTASIAQESKEYSIET